VSAAETPPDRVPDLSRVLDIQVQLSVELGRARMPIRQILQLNQGSVVDLDAIAGEPVDVLVNGQLIAKGDIVVVDNKFGVRLTSVATAQDRVERLGKK
jgi:flagellar motor switch protein FliN/FliY